MKVPFTPFIVKYKTDIHTFMFKYIYKSCYGIPKYKNSFHELLGGMLVSSIFLKSNIFCGFIS